MPVYLSLLDGIIECIRMGARHGRKNACAGLGKQK